MNLGMWHVHMCIHFDQVEATLAAMALPHGSSGSPVDNLDTCPMEAWTTQLKNEIHL